ncbi:MAG: UDP-N-acetylglucosamine 1-carboxyvinyltransferase [Anaerolineales bacterium]|nr:UDP-N-acetylglucosamine 1-carboxyvinyltransferase [Anaerolineales bacterium]
MEYFQIYGGKPLHGEITPSGNKNAALPLLAACLLTDEPVIMHNVPEIRDVLAMRDLLISLGVQIETVADHTWRIHAQQVRPADLDTDLCCRIRASILLAGPVVARAGELHLPPPGGDVIGRRRVDTHILALEALGTQVEYDRVERVFHFVSYGLTGSDILLDEASVTATENAIMAAATASGTTILHNAASEPHVQELCHLINTLGGKITHIGSNTLHIEGVPKLGGGEFTIGPDYLEVVSFIGAAVVTGGSIRIREAGPKYLDMVRLVFRRLGVHWEIEGNDIIVPADQTLKIEPDIGHSIPQINVMPWPAFPTDLMSIAIVVATQAEGTILFHDWMYEGRMYFTDKLSGMGAQIVLCDPHRCIVQGPAELIGENVESPDIRAGLALVLAALAAKGKSTIRNVGQIDRGYERIDEKLLILGADIERLKE